MSTAPEVGALVRDMARDRVGEVLGYRSGRAVLRTSGYGRTWEADPEELRSADANDRLRARVNEMNARRL